MKQKPSSLAKITRPSFSGIVPRGRLFRLLDEGRRYPVLWVSGPPGSGKTTLITSYLDARKLPALWYRIDEGDADLATFFYYMGLAAKKAAPRKRKPLPLLTPEYLLGLPTFTLRYFENLYSRLPIPSCIVLDNYQKVPSEAGFHEMLLRGLELLPQGVNAMVISRTELPPPFARLQANEKLYHLLGWNDIRLTLDECREIVQRKVRRRLGEDLLIALHQKTDGWIGGLVLWAGNAKVEALELPLSSVETSKGIFEYFAGEIFNQTAQDVQTFSLKTACFPMFTPEMAEALTENPRAKEILADLYRRNYFISLRQIGQTVSYHYHALFREFLLHKTGETLSPRQILQIQQEAAAILEAHGQEEEALALFLDAGVRQEAARLIGKLAPALTAQGRGETLAGWIKSLPPELLDQSPWLLYWLGACRLPHDPPEARQCFDKAFALFLAQRDRDGALLAWSSKVETAFHGLGGFPTLDSDIEAFEALPLEYRTFSTVELEARVTAAMLAALMLRQPHHPEIAQWAERALSLLQTSLDPNLRVQIGIYLAVYCMWMGDRARATLVLDLLREAARSGGISPLGQITVKTTEAMYNWVVAAECASSLEKAREARVMGEDTGVYLWNFHLLVHRCGAALSAGDLATAEALIRQMTQELAKARSADLYCYQHLAVWSAILRGNLAEAMARLPLLHEVQTELGAPFFEALGDELEAQVALQRGDHPEAARLLARALVLGRRMRSRLIEFTALLEQARLFFDAGEEKDGLEVLRSALAIGRQQGLINTFSWQPSVMARLCAKALEHGIEVEYVRTLIRKRRLIPEEPPWRLERWPWPLKVFTLGRFGVLKDDTPLRFRGKARHRPLELLQALIAFGGREVSEDRLAEALWPEAEGDLAHHDLRTTLYRLRKLLGPEQLLVVQEGRLSLDPAACWVDVWALQRLLAEIEARRRERRTGIAAAELCQFAHQILTLYRGAFLGEELAASWALSLRERLEQKVLRVLLGLGRECEQAGVWEQALDCYRKALEVDDLAEEGYRQIMSIYRQLGHRAEALAVYHRCRQTLAARLGVAPSAETEALAREIRQEG